ncbi:hypothetical protein HMPREF1301_01185 [Propionibacterium sp. KPL2005]|nr:hypothetical protein HMPREF1301_01185 [Propionibacterium sp. KPL2005]ERS30066.1 hypothetical protein HMPREF1297_00893 [Propionibacterium sp. KPL2000]
MIIGGGYIGAELAAALVQQGCEVSLVTPDPILGGSQFPAQIASEYQKLFADAGVHLVTGHRVSSVRKHENAEVTLDDGIILEADDVVAGLGATPVTNLAEDAGLTVDNGVVVDEYLRTDDPAIWAAGDIANYPDSVLGRTRVEHVDNATMMGKAAGRSMAGSDTPYTHTPMMYSQVFGGSLGGRWRSRRQPSDHLGGGRGRPGRLLPQGRKAGRRPAVEPAWANRRGRQGACRPARGPLGRHQLTSTTGDNIMDLGLNGRVALITGADSGIGWNTAKLLLAEGAKVAVTDLDADELTKAAKGLDAAEDRLVAFPADVTDADSLAELHQQVKEAFGPIDILVQSAGVTGAQGKFHEIDEEG